VSDTNASLFYNPVHHNALLSSCSSVCEGEPVGPFHKRPTLAPYATNLYQLQEYAEAGNFDEVYRFLGQYCRQSPGSRLHAAVFALALERQHARAYRDSAALCRSRLLSFLSGQYSLTNADALRAGLLAVMARGDFALGDVTGCESRIAQLRGAYPSSPHARTMLPLLLAVAMAKNDTAQVAGVFQDLLAAGLDPAITHSAWNMKRGYERVRPRTSFPKRAAAGDEAEERAAGGATLISVRTYPNPFNPSTTIEYALPEETQATLSVYNALGKRIATLVDGVQPGGAHRAIFNAPSWLPSGVYTYVLSTTLGTATGRMLLAR